MIEENGHGNGNTQLKPQHPSGKRLEDIHSVVHNFKPLALQFLFFLPQRQ